MDSGAAAPPPDEGWHFEWRWGAAHPWLRSHIASSSSVTSAVSSTATSSPLSPSSALSSTATSSPLSPSSALSSASPCCSSCSSLHGSTGVTSEPSPFAIFPTSKACPASVETRKPEPHDTLTSGEGCPKEATFSSFVRPSASSWLLSLPFLSWFRGTHVHGIAAASQHESAAGTTSQANAQNTAAPIAVAGAAASPLPTVSFAETLPEGGMKETELALENGAESTPAQSVVSAVTPGAKELTRVEGRQQEATASVIASGSETLLWIPTVKVEIEPVSLPETMAATDYGASGKRGIETKVETTREAAVLSDMFAAAGSTSASAAPTASAATSARSATSGVASATSPTAKVYKEKVELRNLADTTHRQKQVQQLLLQFGDQTLSFLQKQQMTLWSVFAFRDWRVKTLVHALSAMGEPVNLVVVNCTPPQPSHPSSPSLSSSPAGASGSSLVSGGSSLSSPRSSFSSSLPGPNSVPHTTSQVEKGGLLSAAEPLFEEQQSHFAASGAGTDTLQPFVTHSPELSSLMPSAASERVASPSTDAGRTTAGDTNEAGRASRAPYLASASSTLGDDVVRGGYSPLYHTIWLCGNRLWSPFELRRVLLHELVHAFDFARANISPDDCRHVACTEIRAYNLSGQCGWWRTHAYDIEQFNTVEPLPLRHESEAAALQHQQEGDHTRDSGQWQQTKRNRCLMHGALNSLGQHRRCQAPNVAIIIDPDSSILIRCRQHGTAVLEEAVRDVFTRCVRDTWPFLAPPERDSKWRPSRMWRTEAAEFFKK